MAAAEVDAAVLAEEVASAGVVAVAAATVGGAARVARASLGVVAAATVACNDM